MTYVCLSVCRQSPLHVWLPPICQ